MKFYLFGYLISIEKYLKPDIKSIEWLEKELKKAKDLFDLRS